MILTGVVGGFAIAMGLWVLLFTKQLASASERTRVTNFRGEKEGRSAAGWQGFSKLITRFVGVGFILVGILLLTNVLHLR